MRPRIQLVALLSLCAAVPQPALAKRKKAAAAGNTTSTQTARAVGELAGKFRWGMTPEDVQKIVFGEIEARYVDRIKKETSAFKQDALRRELRDEEDKFKNSYMKFDGQPTGWDVSIIDREFAHKNNESMLVIWEKDQRRFLFFYQRRLWKQFIAFNAEHPAFANKTFDDFANIIQRRYGPAAMTFRKMRTSDEQLLDHLEWPPAGDYILWAIDLTSFYGNFCLSLMQASKVQEIERARAVTSPKPARAGASLVDAAIGGQGSAESNADIVDQITGRAADGTLDKPLVRTPATPANGSRKSAR